MKTLAAVLPWFLPGLAISAMVAVAVSDRVARRIHGTRAHAVLLVVSAGAVLAATLPPVGNGFPGEEPSAAGTCDLARVVPASPVEYARMGDEGLNLVLFVPLGLAVWLLRPSPAKVGMLVAAVASPVVIEATQSLVPLLGRGCQSQDVVDDLLGLGLGLSVGALTLAVGSSRWMGRRSTTWR